MKKDIEYFVNRERGIVVCKINNCASIALNRIDKYTRLLWMTQDRLWIPDTFTGIAKCAPEDTFDEEYGKKLALLRAKQARAAAINGKISEVLDIARKELDLLEKYGMHPIPKMEEE